MELDCYYQRLNKRVGLQTVEQFKTWEIRKFRENLEIGCRYALVSSLWIPEIKTWHSKKLKLNEY